MKRSASIIIAAAFALLGACASSEEAAPAEQKSAGSFKSIPAPTREGIATRITADDNGKTVNVAKGTKIAVELVGVPTAGYIWAVAEAPSFLAKIGETGGPTSEAQLEPGFAGGSHWEVFFFEVTGTGEGALRLEQRRPWEDEGPADSTFTVSLKAN
jgi:predicted secreted protein